MKKRGIMQKKLAEFEYESTRKGGSLSRLERSLMDLERALVHVPLGGKKDRKKET